MQTGKIGRQFRPERKDFAARGVLDRQYMGMQGLSAKALECLVCRWRQQPGFGLEAGSIDIVTQQRMAGCGEVNADLMGPSGLEPAGEEARRSEGLDHAPMGDGVTAASFGRDRHGHNMARACLESARSFASLQPKAFGVADRYVATVVGSEGRF